VSSRLGARSPSRTGRAALRPVLVWPMERLAAPKRRRPGRGGRGWPPRKPTTSCVPGPDRQEESTCPDTARRRATTNQMRRSANEFLAEEDEQRLQDLDLASTNQVPLSSSQGPPHWLQPPGQKKRSAANTQSQQENRPGSAIRRKRRKNPHHNRQAAPWRPPRPCAPPKQRPAAEVGGR
jgi:hypothetical protein